MRASTLAILTLADTLPGGRAELIADLAGMLDGIRYYSVESIAEMLDVSKSCVNTWRAKGMLVPSLKVPGGTARYTLADINKFLREYGRKEELTEADAPNR